MNEDFKLVAECCICGRHVPCIARDDDLDGVACAQCVPHILVANHVMFEDLESAGIDGIRK